MGREMKKHSRFLKVAAIALVGVLAGGGCTTAMQSACMSGQGFNGMSVETTCQAAAIQGQQQQQAATIAVGVLAAGVLGFSAYEATRPSYNYVYVY
jgi:hypothetical protein